MTPEPLAIVLVVAGIVLAWPTVRDAWRWR